MTNKAENRATWLLSVIAVVLMGMIAFRLTMVYGNVTFAGKADSRPPVASADR